MCGSYLYPTTLVSLNSRARFPWSHVYARNFQVVLSGKLLVVALTDPTCAPESSTRLNSTIAEGIVIPQALCTSPSIMACGSPDSLAQVVPLTSRQLVDWPVSLELEQAASDAKTTNRMGAVSLPNVISVSFQFPNLQLFMPHWGQAFQVGCIGAPHSPQ